MTTTKPSVGARRLLLGILGLFVIARLAGGYFELGIWSFRHWQHTGWLFDLLWLATFAGLTWFAWAKQEKIGRWFQAPISVVVPLLVLITLFWWFRFDTFLYGGGNVQVGQIARLEQVGGVVIYRWYEFGSVLLAHWLYLALQALGVESIEAGANAWRLLTYLATVLSMTAALQIARLISPDRVRRVFTFLIIFFGGQTLLYFGYIGLEPLIVPVTLWFGYTVCRINRSPGKISPVIWLWLIQALGVFLHISLLFLLPAAIYATVAGVSDTSRARKLGLIGGLVTFVILVAFLYMQASDSLALAARVLFPEGKAPLYDYGLFSLRHLADFLQILFLAVPTLFLLKWLLIQRRSNMVGDRSMMAGWFMALGGLATVLILDPNNSVVLDLPRLLAYLAPYGFLTALVLNDTDSREPSQRLQLLPIVAVAAVMLPISYLPAYVDVGRADHYIDKYLRNHVAYYKSACYAFRDAYFYVEDYDKATTWEQAAEQKSPERINLTGSAFLIAGDDDSEGIRTLHQLISRDRYWAEPRSLLARALMSRGQYAAALAQIDTSLMLEPYGRQHRINQYECYRDMQRYDRALEVIQEALALFPADTFITTDLMLVNFRARNYRTADSIATELISSNPAHAYAHFVRGAMADQANDTAKAIRYYGKFVELAGENPDVPSIQQRIQELQGNEQP